MAGPTDELFEVPGGAESEDYQTLLDDYSQYSPSAEGQILHGHVLSVSEKEVIVDIGRKIEGLVPASQFPLLDGKPDVHPGDLIEVMIDRNGPQQEGYICCHTSAHTAGRRGTLSKKQPVKEASSRAVSSAK